MWWWGGEEGASTAYDEVSVCPWTCASGLWTSCFSRFFSPLDGTARLDWAGCWVFPFPGESGSEKTPAVQAPVSLSWRQTSVRTPHSGVFENGFFLHSPLKAQREFSPHQLCCSISRPSRPGSQGVSIMSLCSRTSSPTSHCPSLQSWRQWCPCFLSSLHDARIFILFILVSMQWRLEWAPWVRTWKPEDSFF